MKSLWNVSCQATEAGSSSWSRYVILPLMDGLAAAAAVGAAAAEVGAGAAGLAAVGAGAGGLVGCAAGAAVGAGAVGAAGLQAAATNVAPVTPSAVNTWRRLHAPPGRCGCSGPRGSCLSDIRCTLPRALGLCSLYAVLTRPPTSRAGHHSNLRPNAALSASRR